jgi:group I intron endonuclease
MAKSGIYAIKRTGTDEQYIGSAVDIARRWREHRSKLDRGIHEAAHMQNVWNKHGDVFDFVILELVDNKDALIGREQAWLDKFSPTYNTLKVAGSRLGFKHTPEAKAKIAAAGNGRRHTQASIVKMSEARKGKKCSPETCAKISAVTKGHTRGVGRRVSESTRAKMSAARIGANAKLNESMVIDIFRSTAPLRVVAEMYGISQTNVSMIRNGRIWVHITSGVV